MKIIKIDTDYIKLGQFLKHANLIQSGGMARMFLSEYTVLVNGEEEDRRGRKLYKDDQIEIEDFGSFTIS